MGEFSKVIGHEKIIQYFQNAIVQNKLAHSYIITGEKGSGKKLLASLFVKTIQCEEQGSEPCGKCRSCIQADAGSQPDIKWITHEKPASIGATDVREQLVGDIIIKPYSSRYKIYIIDEAQKLTMQAQNALLKTIEEPPSYGIIIFLATNADMFLPTIISRCVEINLHPVSDELIKKYLMEEKKLPNYMADICTAFSQGNLGRALQLAGSSDFDAIKSHLVRLMNNVGSAEISSFLTFIKELESNEFNVNDYLDLMLMWYRDVLIFKASRDKQRLIFREEADVIAIKAAECSYEGINKVILAIDEAKARLKANVNEEVVMELMFLTIKEN